MSWYGSLGERLRVSPAIISKDASFKKWHTPVVLETKGTVREAQVGFQNVNLRIVAMPDNRKLYVH